MSIFFGILIGFFVLMFLVTAHEFGHFIMARKNGVDVNEFGIGFPPRAIAWVKIEQKSHDQSVNKSKSATAKSTSRSKSTKVKSWRRLTKSEWDIPQDSLIFSLNWLPIGGFCAMKGESDSDRTKGSFGAATFWAKTKILFGGVAMNWLVAFIILTILSLTGMPKFVENQFSIAQDLQIDAKPAVIHSVKPKSPAQKAGLHASDKIKSINDHIITSATEVAKLNHQFSGQTVKYVILRNDQELTFKIKLNPAKDSTPPLGISIAESGQTLYRSTWSAPIVGAVTTVQLTGETFRGLGELFWNFCSGIIRQISPDDATRAEGRLDLGKARDSVSGPVGIIGIIFPEFASAGLTNLAFLAAVISISLACMNVLPIPALDGGRWLLITIFRLRKKTLTKEIEAKVVSRAFAFLFLLVIVITIIDITRLF